MATVTFTANLRRHLSTDPKPVDAATVYDALEQLFTDQPAMRSYLLDDQGAVRKHVTVFVDGEAIDDRDRQSDPLPPDAEVYIAQALSGG